MTGAAFPGLTLEPSSRPVCTLVIVTGELDLRGYGLLRDGLLKVAADSPPGLVADIDGLAIGELAPAAVFPLVARRVGDWPGIPFSVVTSQESHLRTFHRFGTDRFVAVHADVEAAERQQTTPIRRQAERAFSREGNVAALARTFVREQALAWHVPEVIYDGTLIVGELVGNTVRHTRSAPRVRLDLRRGLLTIAVTDEDPRPAVLLEREDPRDPGVGLRIVAQAARAWGSNTRWSGGKVVWAVVATAQR